MGRGILKDVALRGKIVIVADRNVQNLGKHLAQQWSAILLFSENKTKASYDHLMEQLFQNGCDRDTTLVALGGGTICDLVGFVAATFMRGIPLILIPTTLLAMVDASIGGKTAIDLALGKNLIGSLYFPKMVISDLETLCSLPDSEWLNGRAEMLKMGLIREPSLYTSEINDELICKAIAAKIEVVEQDPDERGFRRILNFGHTIGHGLEILGETIPHGRAVALGSLAEAHLSMSCGFLPEKVFDEIVIPYQQFLLKLPSSYTRESFLKKMEHDKKKKDGNLRFVLINDIGNALPFDGDYCYPVPQKILETTLDWLEKNYG